MQSWLTTSSASVEHPKTHVRTVPPIIFEVVKANRTERRVAKRTLGVHFPKVFTGPCRIAGLKGAAKYFEYLRR